MNYLLKNKYFFFYIINLNNFLENIFNIVNDIIAEIEVANAAPFILNTGINK